MSAFHGQDLHLDQLFVVHGGKDSWPIDRKVRAVAAADVLHEIEPLG